MRQPLMVTATAAAADGAQTDAKERLLDWLVVNGTKGVPELDVTEAGSVIAKGAISPGQPMLRIPEKLCITTYDAGKHDLVGELVADKDEYVALALWLLAERARGADSHWEAFVSAMPEKTESPILWDDAQREVLLKGSPVLETARMRAAAIDLEYGQLKEQLASAFSEFSPEAYSLEAFKNAFSVVLSQLVFLPSVGVLALVPMMGGVQQVGEKGAVIDYDTETSMVTLTANEYFISDDKIKVADNLARSNGEMLLSTGMVDPNNPCDYLEYPCELLSTDMLYTSKLAICEAVGLSGNMPFPLYKDRMPFQLLAFLRMSRVTDVGQLAAVNFQQDAKVSEMNEYETLMVMMGDLRERMDQYDGNLEEDMKLLQNKEMQGAERVAAKLRYSEKLILTETMSAVRRRLAPIRGIPTKSGQMVDPNADIMEIFETIEAIPNAPKKALKGFMDWASGKDDPDWGRK